MIFDLFCSFEKNRLVYNAVESGIIGFMIIGLVLLGITALLLFLGIARRVFSNFGVPYLLAFVIVGVLIGSAFIPAFDIGRVSVNAAGFIAPLTFSVMFLLLAKRRREVWYAIVASSSTAAVYAAVLLLISPITSVTVTVISAGFLCGAVAYLVGRTELSALAAVFAGLPIGEVVSSIVGYFSLGRGITLGTAATFDTVILAAVFAVVLSEAISAIRRTMNTRNKKIVLEAEAAEEFDPDEYKRYFDE